MSLEELATEVIEELDKYAQEVIEYCRTNGLDEKQLYDLVVIRRENPLKRDFLNIGFSFPMHPWGVGTYVSYEFSEMLGEHGFEKNRVKHFNYSNDPKDRPESQKSVELITVIHRKLLTRGTYKDLDFQHSLFDTPNGIYLLEQKYGNPFGNIKYEPHFELSKKITIG